MCVSDQTISYGNAAGRVTLRVEHGVLWLKLEQDPHGSDVVECLERALAQGWLTTGMPILVDMLDFNGNIDWGAVRAIREIMPCAGAIRAEGARAQGLPASGAGAEGQARATVDRATQAGRVGYVTRDPMFAPVLRIIRDLFTRSRHRQFRDPEPALLWVCQPETEFREEE
jgi:hypothetical protein